MERRNWFGSPTTQDRTSIIKQRSSISVEDRESMLAYGEYYFDGETPLGYGGYYYYGRFQDTVGGMISHYGLDSSSRVLDIGCAKGFLLYEFWNAGVSEVAGVDISEYAISNVPQEIADRCFAGSADELWRWPDSHFDLVLSKDVLHNLPPGGADRAIQEIVRVGGGRGFLQINSYETEHQRRCLNTWVITIKTVRSATEWLEKFRALGYDGDYNFLTFDYEIE